MLENQLRQVSISGAAKENARDRPGTATKVGRRFHPPSARDKRVLKRISNGKRARLAGASSSAAPLRPVQRAPWRSEHRAGIVFDCSNALAFLKVDGGHRVWERAKRRRDGQGIRNFRSPGYPTQRTARPGKCQRH